MLLEFLTSHREELISRCRVKVAQRQAPCATGRELDYGIPVFLTQFIDKLREEMADCEAKSASDAFPVSAVPIALGIETTAVRHGIELLLKGYTVDQVVHDYGDLCQAVTELAMELDAPITNREFHSLNRCLDNAIADAVSAFAREHDRVIADASEYAMNERMGFLAHEFRNLINTAMLAVNTIRHGKVGMGDPLELSSTEA